MGGTLELRRRHQSIGNIKQITRAMEMVATTKLRRFQDRTVASRPYASEIAGLVSRLAAMLGDEVDQRPLFKRGAGEATALLVVTSDRGLCGAYNSNVLRKLETWLASREGQGPVRYFVVGRKGYQYLTKRGREVDRYFVDPPLERIDYSSAVYIAGALAKAFLSGELADVQVLFTTFESMGRYVPQVVPLLPIRAEGLEEGEASGPAAGDVILEPDADTIFDRLVPRYVETAVYNALLESLTSEFASRRLSMKNATEAASDMQDYLLGLYNRLRQESITTELLDIVGGAEALR